MPLFSGKPVFVTGTGIHLPKRVLTNQDLEKMVDTTDEWIVERTGIRTRHIAAPGELTSDLAYAAGLEALGSAGLKPENLDMILVATNSPDTLFPGVAAKVQGKLEATRAGAADLQSGCTGCVYALAIATAGIASGLWENVLVVGAEVLSSLINWQDRNTCVLFGDGAGAMVLSSNPAGALARILSSDLRSDGTRHDLISFPGGLVENPTSPNTLEENLHSVQMKGNEVFKFVNQALPGFLRESCEKSGLEPAQIDWWIFHQANLRIIDSVLKRLQVDSSKTFVNLDKYGNTSAASVFLAFHEAYAEGKLAPSQKVLITSFGAGMTYGDIILEMQGGRHAEK
ncbi:MAG: ketoacyl-ACP synthase III [Synergistaceae bacterium]|jgi:3-oxoacyl-[acyl-carrier-protein] synthase-3|nr:ketoacyl-ACP synthase III [Synergistaceae bacterium]